MWTVHVRDNGGRFPVTAKSKGMWLPVRPPGCRWKGDHREAAALRLTLLYSTIRIKLIRGILLGGPIN